MSMQKNRTRRTRHPGALLALALLLAAMAPAGCGELPEYDEADTTGPARPGGSITLDSASGCRIDADCAAGTHCFQRMCVWECTDDADCGAGALCSERSRCLSSERVLAAKSNADRLRLEELDESHLGEADGDIGSIDIVEWPPLSIPVRPGEPFVEATLRTSAPLPEGVLLYTVLMPEDRGTAQAHRAVGDDTFTLLLPTGVAGGDEQEVQTVQITTAMGSRTLYLTPQRPRAGLYAGTFNPRVFGGAGLPLDFAIETTPEHVGTISEASAAWLWIPTSDAYLVSLAGPGEQARWVRRPLEWDAESEAWVAIFAQDLAAARYFGPDAFVGSSRTLRVEISEEDGDVVLGAVADRWRGIYERTGPDGIREPGVPTVSGQFTVDRVGPLPAQPVRDGSATPGPLPSIAPPALAHCDAAVFAATIVVPDDPELDPTTPCGPITNAAAFRSAPAQERATCALAVADSVLSGPTITSMLNAILDPNQPNPGGMSFRAFIEACASQSDPLCNASPDLLCARDLVAHAYRDAGAAGDTLMDLSTAYERTTREAFIGRQLAAFEVDTRSRLDWLRSSEAPLFLAAALRDYNESILNAWKDDVLDAHVDGVFGQLDAAGLSVLTRATTDPLALANRRELLLELANSWRAAMDALVLLTSRTNVLYQDDARRAASTEYVRRVTFRLYLTAAILQELNRETGTSHLGSSFGAGFSVLLRDLNRLAMPFNRLIFARDAEVVASRSLDPTSNARSLLVELERDARSAVRSAQASVDLVLDEAQQTAVDELTLAAQYEDQLLSLRNELIELCGLPSGCAASDVGADPACDIPTEAGRCGFVIERQRPDRPRLPLDSEARSISEAGIALSSLQDAALGVQQEEERLRALVQRGVLLGETVEAFANRVVDWDNRRRAVASEVNTLLDEIASFQNDLIDAQLQTLREEQRIREVAYERQRASVDEWNRIRVNGIEQDLRRMGAMNGLRITSSVIGFAADRTDLFAEIFKDATPKVAGAATDPSFVSRLSVRFPAAIASSALGAAALTLDAIASSLEVSLEGAQMMREAQLENLAELEELNAMRDENDIADLEQRLATLELTSQREINSLNALAEAIRRNFELDMAHERDLQELRDRRDAWRSLMVDLMRYEYQVQQAELTARQRELNYYEVVQRAQLLDARFRTMQARWQNLESLLGSPDVIFSFAGRMARAESRIDRARRALEDWLVALEYYAVRPFVDQRMAILLARNPSQLEAIANELLRLQRVCGGPVTRETLDVSVRDGLLRMGYGNEAPAGLAASPAEQFRALLARADVPVQRRIRLSTTETVGQRFDRGNLLAVEFSLSPEDFANLPLTCNAKLDSVAVQLVGDDLGAGQPVVTLIYDGASELRSCQPGIAQYVAQFGPDSTAFAPTTSFRTAGRAVSPVAGIGEFGPVGTANATLDGLPLASGYTVLIDLDHPSNAAIAWDRLEDIHLRLRYNYQDVFPEGQCD